MQLGIKYFFVRIESLISGITWIFSVKEAELNPRTLFLFINKQLIYKSVSNQVHNSVL